MQSSEGSPVRVDAKKLLDEFAARAAAAEEDKAQLLERLDGSSQASAAILSLERTAAAQAEEIRDLQRALGNAHALVMEERAWRLHHGHVPLHLRGGGGGGGGGCGGHGAEGPAPAQKSESPWQGTLRHRGSTGGARHMAHAHIDAQPLASKLESLQARYELEGREAQEHIAKLLEDRRVRERECRAQAELLQARLDEAQQRLGATQADAQSSMRDCIIARQEQAGVEASAAASIARLEIQRQEAAAKHVHVKRQLAQQAEEAQAAAAEALATAQHCRAAQRKHAAARDQEAAQLRADAAAAQARAEQRVAAAQRKTEAALRGRAQLNHRRAMDVQGFANDISLLRKVVGAVDRRLLGMRLADRLDHDERLEALLSQLQARQPGEVDATVLEDVTNIADRRQTFDEAEEALGKVAETLDSMQQRVAPLATSTRQLS